MVNSLSQFKLALNTLSASEKTVEFTNTVDPEEVAHKEVAHKELPHLDLHCLPSRL